MPKSNANLALKGLNEMFSTEESRQEQKREQVQQIPIEELFPFKEHPFKVLDDEAMQCTVESVAQYGVLAPLIVRPRPEGGYEIISGHRRQYAAELAGLDTLPVIVRQMSDDAAVILMVDSNLQREHILPSERAFAYKMKLDAIKNQGARSDLTSTQVAQKLSVEKVGDDAGVCRNAIPQSAGRGGMTMQFNHDELMLMMLYNTGTRQGLVRELRLMQCYLMPVETALRELSEQVIEKLKRLTDAEFAELEFPPD